MPNTLYFGDNLHVLREYVKDDSIDLVYLDPPFNSKASYNVLFKSPVGGASSAQIQAFEDTWTWEDGAELALEEVRKTSIDTFKLLQALQSFLGQSDVMAYLVMMAPRLIELRRALKPTGCLYLHCDPTASHYLKILMDGIFGPDRFLNEITWKRTHSHGNVGRNFGGVTDTLLFYSCSGSYAWNQLYAPFSKEYVEQKFRWADTDGRKWQSVTLRNPSPRPNLRFPFTASNGKTYQPHPNGWACDATRLRRYDDEGRLHFPSREGGQLRLKMYLDESPGVKLQNLWDDIPALNSQAQERLGYPTQKPLALLERIIQASSNPGDVVLDPFCGCGTAIHAAEKLGRHWIGIDITYLAIQVIEDRLRSWLPNAKYRVEGIPYDEFAARALAKRDPYQFQLWAVGRVGGQPRGKGADRGIDGEIAFLRGARDYGHGIVSVKAGQHVNPDMVRALKGTVERERADIGVFICLDQPTKEVRREAASGGRVDLPGGNRPRIQIATVADLIAGPNLGILTGLNTIQAAEAVRSIGRRKPKAPTPEELRRQPRMKLPIQGGGKKGGQKTLPLDEPLLSEPAPTRRKRKRAS